MSINLEIESKVMITREDYKKLLKEFSHEKTYTQTNFYILPINKENYSKEFGIRIRKKNHNFELTIKQNLKIAKKEINQKISRKSHKFFVKTGIFPDGEVKDFIIKNCSYNIEDLRILGKMITTRTDINFEGSLISIDKSKYNGKIDYEIECEDKSINSAETKLKKFLSSRNIKYEKSKYSKLARFLLTK